MRVSAPKVHWFETQGKIRLRLTRFKAGAKGPVILSHGLGVSSRIFTIDTIERWRPLAEAVAGMYREIGIDAGVRFWERRSTWRRSR